MTNHAQQPAPGDQIPAGLDSVKSRYRLFAAHMAACENAAKAARLAGYSEHPGTSKATGSRLMQDPDVVEMVEEEREARRQRLRIDDQRVMDAYAAIAFGDTRCVVRWNEFGQALICSSDELTDDEAMLVQGVTRRERVDANGDRVVTMEFKFSDRLQALNALARARGLLSEKADTVTTDDVAADMEVLRRRRLERIAASSAAKLVCASASFFPPIRLRDDIQRGRPGRAARFLAAMHSDNDHEGEDTP
jgi:phage terminase small subunit